MDRPTRRERRGDRARPALGTALTAAMLALAAAHSATAQPVAEVPRPDYFSAVNELYRGDYNDAERALRRAVQHSVKTTQARWIDSIAAHAMLGEVLYQQGRNAEALAEFNQACQLMLAYSDWLKLAQFRQGPRADTSRNRRSPPWGLSGRQATLGQLPAFEMVRIGNVSQEQAFREGGRVQSAQFWRVNAQEIVRTGALAMRRRNEILGPLGKYDPISKDLVDLFSRNDLAPPNHWSAAWIELELGLALAGVGRDAEAQPHLARAVLLNGQFDHPLTCVALLEQGRLAMAAGNARAAEDFFREAAISGYYYDNSDVVSEALWLGWINNMGGGPALYPPLPVAATWADANGLRHISVRLQLAQAESLINIGRVDQAAALLQQATRRLGEMRIGRPGIHQAYLEAVVRLQQGQTAAGNELLAKAIVAQGAASLRNFQIVLASELYDTRGILSRSAAELYALLLADPTPAEWATWPLDAIAVLKTPHDGAYDRWLAAALERNDMSLAVEIADRAKRHRFLASLPLGGRMMALRTLLEAPQDELTREQVLERQTLLAAFPAYQALNATGEQLADQLRAGPVVAQAGDDGRAIADGFDAWRENVVEREQILSLMALRRLPSSMVFPPVRTTDELQQSLGDGEALVVFHFSGGQLLGFLVTSDQILGWRIEDPRQLATTAAGFLQDLGNYGPTRTFSFEELRKDEWRDSGAELFDQLFGDSRLDLAQTKSLVVVPDGVVWYVPMGALVASNAAGPSLLAERVALRCGPTAALAVADERPLRRPQHTGIVADDLKWFDSEADREAALGELEAAVPGAVRLAAPLSEPGWLVAPLLDELVNLDDLEPSKTGPYDWSPLPRSRGGGEDSLAAWFGLPYGGPERVVLMAFSTAAESGLKGARRRANRPLPGHELFLSTCGLMSSGARTILISRWRTSGQTSLDLAREFVQELPHTSAADAWQRSVLLARETPLEPEFEQRVKRSTEIGDVLSADHPFFWAGYLLVDNSPAMGHDGDDAMGGVGAAPFGGAGATPPNEPPAGADLPPPQGN